MNDQWIKMSDRNPTETDLPIWAESPEWGEPVKPRLFYDLSPLIDKACIPARSWMPARLPAPPPTEKTQKELDEEAWERWSTLHETHWAADSWHAAIAWERKEMAAMLKPLLFVSRSKQENDAIDSLRKRCGLK